MRGTEGSYEVCAVIGTGDADERRQAIAALMAVLVATPQFNPDSPEALSLPEPPAQGPAQSSAPLHYRELERAFSEMEFESRRRGGRGRAANPTGARMPGGDSPKGTTPRVAQAAKPASKKRARRGAVEALSPQMDADPTQQANAADTLDAASSDNETGPNTGAAATGAASPSANGRRRGGRGGRMPRKDGRESALRQALDRLGQPDDILSMGQARTAYWVDRTRSGRLHRDPETISFDLDQAPLVALLLRLSSGEQQNGEQLGGQLLDCQTLATEFGLHIAEIIASTDLSGDLKWEERMEMDFGRLKTGFEEGRFVGFVARDHERVARRTSAALFLGEWMEEEGWRMWLTCKKDEVDWKEDFLSNLIEHGVSAQDRRKIVERMETAKRRAWVGEGRGWPGALRFGFKRHPETNFPEIDEEQWPIVLHIHKRYGDGDIGSPGLERELAEMGWDLCQETIRRILNDPIYFDGTYATNYRGHMIAAKPIEIPAERRIPAELFQRNQERLATHKGQNSRHPEGTFLLNKIPVVCADCEGERREKYGDREPRFKGSSNQHYSPAYYMTPFVGKHCYGRPLQVQPLEEAVVRALWKLADDPDVARA